MGQALRIEHTGELWFITTRTIRSRLWFVSNSELHNAILGLLAKLQARYQVKIYSFCIEGNHYHLIACFPLGNKSAFMRDLNSGVARLTNQYVSNFYDGKLWARRYDAPPIKGEGAYEHWMLYVALNPVISGLVKDTRDYNSYNSFFDCIEGIERKYSVIDWELYNDKKRYHPELKPSDFEKTYILKLSRLPGYESLSQEEYKQLMLEKYENRRQEAIQERLAQGKGFATPKMLRKIKPGTIPISTKKSDRYTPRPLVLTLDPELRKIYLQEYFDVVQEYREASYAYRNGDCTVEFPKGTYTPHKITPIALADP